MARYYACGVPREHCNGAGKQVDACGRSALKVHPNSKEAFKCYVRYMIVEMGHKRVENESRLLQSPDGSFLMLTKQSKFGCAFRLSKNEKGIGNRVRPVHKCITGS